MVLRDPKCANKISPPPLHHTSSLNRWDKAGWIHAFMFFTTNYDSNIWIKSRLIRPGNVFKYSIVQFWWSCVNCILRVLLLSDRSGTRCGLLLLEPICFRVRCVVCSEMVFCITWLLRVVIWVTVAFLLSILSLSILLWPLTSTRHFRPHNCRSLDIFSFFVPFSVNPRDGFVWKSQ